ncbi:MAG: 2Fe-2S iron-sulfur cluster binding domain-containing protein [Clostridia bacterium]|nr:2Fe-2S iron-sulfur cluster binding domain-containing protein [Clostridia bacterium]
MKHTAFSLIRDVNAITGIKKVREAHFESASSAPIKAPAGAVAMGGELHPERISLTVSERENAPDGSVALRLRGDGGRLPVFRPGQYINLLIDGALCPFFLSGTPADALLGVWEITVDPTGDPAAFARIDALREGDELLSGPPVGYFFRQPPRDGETCAVIADGTGLGCALAMQKNDRASAYLCRGADDLPAKQNIIADTVFICGKKVFCESASAAFEGLRTRILFTDAPGRSVGREQFRCTVIAGGETNGLDCYSDEPLINALERNGILLFNKCRTGDCAFCRAKLLQGRVTHFFDSGDGRRNADVKFGFIHPCRAFPDSDVTLKY